MARVHVVQHTATEGLGQLAEWLPPIGVDVHPTHPYLGNRVPPSVEGDALIVMGGPMGAYDDAVAPWLPAVRDLLASAVDDGVPTIGVCLGAQLLAVATGGVVEPGAAGPEIGLGEVTITATDDLLLPAGPMPVVQWHNDIVTTLPPNAQLLGSSDLYATQAFRVGDLAWGLQFHVEATAEMVKAWAVDEGKDPAISEPVAFAEGRLEEVGEEIARRFAAIITG
ncbi:MAG TPA: type 1 glutamine amidotransferase [Mycobacteriales bacterium]|nr:type 1 glutamine amidotransferase [Mycobacteriales bacterium]